MLTMTLQSALEKIFLNDRELPPPYPRGSGLGGERFAFQAVLDWDGWGSLPVTVTVDSPPERPHPTVPGGPGALPAPRLPRRLRRGTTSPPARGCSPTPCSPWRTARWRSAASPTPPCGWR